MTDLVLRETPAARLLGTWPDHAPEWYDARHGRIGGSTIAAICGISPWQSPFSVWCEMAGLVDRDEQTPEQARGHYFEQGITDWFADSHPEWEVRPGGTWVHLERDYQLTNPDRLLYRGGRLVGGLECKTDANAHESGWGRPGTDEVPLYYRAQVMWYMDVFGLPRWHVALLDNRLSLREYVVDYDAIAAAAMRDAAEDFLSDLFWGEMPELDYHTATYKALKKLHPDIADVDVELPGEVAHEFVDAVTALDAAEKRERAARSAVAQAMGRARRAWCNGHHIATRVGGKNEPHVKAASRLDRIPLRELLPADPRKEIAA